ncbi:hypothetical protein TNCV_3210281 [Trichonephila clavipes]|nr:hypothetical protein TNCV_3210281 [Trichonephila clavipes]
MVTVRRHLPKQNIYGRATIPKPFVTEVNDKDRLQLCYTPKTWSIWDIVQSWFDEHEDEGKHLHTLCDPHVHSTSTSTIMVNFRAFNTKLISSNGFCLPELSQYLYKE